MTLLEKQATTLEHLCLAAQPDLLAAHRTTLEGLLPRLPKVRS
jgi:hypothetical protein